MMTNSLHITFLSIAASRNWYRRLSFHASFAATLLQSV